MIFKEKYKMHDDLHRLQIVERKSPSVKWGSQTAIFRSGRKTSKATSTYDCVIGTVTRGATAQQLLLKHLIKKKIKNMPAVQETWIQSLVWEDPLEKGAATHSSVLAWRIPWQRSLVGYSPWGHKMSYTTERLTLSLSLKYDIKNPCPLGFRIIVKHALSPYCFITSGKNNY